MERNIQLGRESRAKAGNVAVVTAVGLSAAFWASVALESIGLSTLGLRAVAGVCFLLFTPGVLLTRALGIAAERIGVFVVFSVGFSLAVVSATVPVVSRLLPIVGVDAPLSFLPVTIALSAVVAALTVVVLSSDREPHRVRMGNYDPSRALLLVVALPIVSAGAALAVKHFRANAGMFLFVLLVGTATVLAATRRLPRRLYPATVFLVALSVLLHRNLVTEHVVGADIQITYFVADLLLEAQRWSPELGGSLMAVPAVTSVPAVFATVTGLELQTVFTGVYVLAFAFVPLALYYVYVDVFDPQVALFGCLFFVFYHMTFYFTPGKQLMSELFLALLLLLFFRTGLDDAGSKVAAALLAVGLVHTHYGTAYVFGLSLLVATVGLAATNRLVGDTNSDLRLAYPVVLLVGTTAWYAYASSELVITLLSVPTSVAGQVSALLAGAPLPAEGTGASTVGSQTTLLEQLNLFIYALLTVLLAVGLAWRTLDALRRIGRGDPPERVEFVALALPFFAFLGATYLVILNLWVERMYQLVLPVLAPFVPLGYLLVARASAGALSRIRGRRSTVPRWLVLAVLLATLFAFNSGGAFALAGASSPYTFDPDAHDLAFSDEEIEAAEWLEDEPDVRRATDDRADASDPVRIYADEHSVQLLRSTVPPGYYDVELIPLKDRWNPEFDRDRVDDGYVFLRDRSLVEAGPDREVPTSSLSVANASELAASGEIVYENEDVRIVKLENRTEGNESSERVAPSSSAAGPHSYHTARGALYTTPDVRPR